MFGKIRFNVACVLFLLTATTAFASSPRLSVITPRGVQRGATYTLNFYGQRLAGAQEIFVYDEGITVQKIEPGKNANHIKVTVEVAADCRLGEHVAQVRTNDGISDYRSFYVGAMPNLEETEPNNEFTAPQVIDLNVTITGVVKTEDVDYYQVNLKKGERLSVEVEGIRLGFLFDAYVAILNSERFELAVCDDTPLLKQDPFVSLVAPEDGAYFIQIRESSYGGNDQSRYRMHVGSFPRPTAIFPAGGKPNEKLKLNFLGDSTGPIAQEIQLPEAFGFRGGLFLTQEDQTTPSAIPFRINDLENYNEVEPNNKYWPKTSIGSAPMAINGIIGEDGDYDLHRFTAKKGQVFDVECFARRVGSGLDPVINVYNAADNKHIMGSDDSRGPDSYLRFPVPADGDYIIRVRDHLKRGAPDFVYRVEFQPVKPKLGVNIPRVDRYSQQRQTIAVPQGGRFATLVNATRADFAGEIALLSENLPPGITMHAQPMRGNLNSMPVVFEASADAELTGSLVDFRAKLVDENRDISGGFSNLADFALGQPNNARYYGCTVDKLAMAIIKKLPYSIEIIQPKAPLVRDGQINIKVVVHRDEGFDNPINIQFPFRPPGVGTNYQLKIPKGVSEFNYPLNANANAQLGTWPIYVIAQADVGGPAWTSSQLAELEVADPYVKFELKRAGVEQGNSTKLLCTLAHTTPFEGEATAEIVGLPPQIKVTPLKFTKDTPELTFDITTTAESPIGKHKGLFCRVTIPKNGESIVATAGRSELQVNKPRPAPKPKAEVAAKPKPAAPEKPAEKPLSRLEQLRKAARENNQ
jgi:hypothetical protein